MVKSQLRVYVDKERSMPPSPHVPAEAGGETMRPLLLAGPADPPSS